MHQSATCGPRRLRPRQLQRHCDPQPSERAAPVIRSAAHRGLFAGWIICFVTNHVDHRHALIVSDTVAPRFHRRRKGRRHQGHDGSSAESKSPLYILRGPPPYNASVRCVFLCHVRYRRRDETCRQFLSLGNVWGRPSHQGFPQDSEPKAGQNELPPPASRFTNQSVQKLRPRFLA